MADARVAPAYEHNGHRVTAEQFYARACDPARSVAVEACAGAGKTWMLVSRMVRALLAGMHPREGQPALQPQEILAITFTKRAATEMRERLHTWLHDFSRAGPEALDEALRIRGVPAQDIPALRPQLAGLYARVLETGRLVQVRTFHSWFAALLKAAPLAVLQRLELPVQYELLEDDTQAVALVWRRFYQALLDAPPSRQDYQELVQRHGRSQVDKALAAALSKRTEFLLADAAGCVDNAVQPFAELFPAFAGPPAPAAMLLEPSVRARWLDWAKALGQAPGKTAPAVADAILEAFGLPGGPQQDEDALLKQLRRALFVKTEDRLTRHLEKFPAAQAAADWLAELCAADRQHQAWRYQQRMARLTRLLIRCHADLKRERGWVDMADVERAAGSLLCDPVLSGWVQERLDARVRHLLIDEFQDTNPLQWQALSSWLGSYAGAGSQAPSVFIVGDPKQSIYRFRRAEPQVFEAAQQFVATVLGGDRLSCDHTRRNAQQVIGVVNATLQAAVAAGAFNGFRTHTTDASAQGQVAVLPPIARATPDHAAAPDPDAGPAGWRDSLTQPREVAEETLRTREARQVAAWIVQCLQAGWQPGELMVLSRRRVGLQPMQQALRALGIPAQIGEKTALGDCCEVQDIVALLDALVSPHHDLSLARALKSPLFGLDDAALVALRLRGAERALSWFDRLQLDWPAGSPLAGLGAQLQRWRVLVRSLPPHDALQAIYTEADVLARFAAAAPADQRSAVLANLRALPEASLQLAGGRYATPYALVRALKAGGVQAPAARLDNAVRLLTVHGAKGLEARGVVLLDTDTPERPGDTMGVLVDWPGQAAHPRQLVFLASETAPPPGVAALLAHEQTQRRREELNALYVAMTRARETLLLSAIEPHRDASGSWWRRLGALNLPMLEAPETAGPARVAGEGEAVVHLPALPDWVPPARPELPPEDSPAARLGKAMHRLLEWGDLTPQRAGLAAREFRLSTTQSAQALDMARRIRSGAGAWVWDPAILDWQGSEVELAVDGQLQRIDRLVRRRDTGAWWVLDYKSAAEPQRQPALVAQLQAYRRAVAGLVGGAPVHAAFLSADGAQIDLPPDP